VIDEDEGGFLFVRERDRAAAPVAQRILFHSVVVHYHTTTRYLRP